MPDKEPRPAASAPVADEAAASIRSSDAVELTAGELPVTVGATAGILGAGVIAALAFAGSVFPRKGAEKRGTRHRFWSRNGNGTP
ncbi:MAG: hypothetical protein ACXIUP_11600 [Microcella sp.]